MNVNSGKRARPTIVDRLLARPGCESPATTVLHLALILAWPAALFAELATIVKHVESLAHEFWSGRGFNRFSAVSYEFMLPQIGEERLLLAAAALTATLLLLVFGWLIYWPATRREPRSIRTFLRRTWRASLACLVLAPCLAYLLMILPPPVSSSVPPLFAFAPLVTFLFGPALIAIGERRRRRVSPQRPSCPECGYSLQHMSGTRCPECGDELPSPQRAYRRWAHRRLRWDRTERGGLPVAWLATLSRVLLRPAAAGAGVCVPDRMGRAVRWAAFWILLICAVGALLHPVIDLGFAVYARLFPERFPVPPFPDESPSIARQALWHAQSLIAWIIVVCAYPAVALFLVGLMPGIGRAARRTLVKWTLFATVSICVGYLIAVAISLAFLPPWFRAGTMSYLYFPYLVSRPPELFVALLFGWVWASGVSGNRWIARRGCETRLITFAAYVVAWWLVAMIAFRPGALMRLL